MSELGLIINTFTLDRSVLYRHRNVPDYIHTRQGHLKMEQIP